MELTLGQIQTTTSVINSIINDEMPIKIGYKFLKLTDAFKQELEYYNKTLSEIILKYCELDENGTPIQENDIFKIKEDCINECQEKLLELQNIEADIPDITFTLDELEQINIKMSDLMALRPLIQE